MSVTDERMGIHFDPAVFKAKGQEIIDEFLAERAEERAERRSNALEMVLTDHIAVCGSEDDLDQFFRALDTDTADDVEIGIDWEGNLLVETVSDRHLNRAFAENRIWSNDDETRKVVFQPRTPEIEPMFSKENLEANPDVIVFASRPELPFEVQADCFHAVGLNPDDFDPPSSHVIDGESLSIWFQEWMPDDDESDDDAPDVQNAPLDLRRLRTQPRKPTEYLLDGVVPVGGFNIGLTGESGSGKSLFAVGAIAVPSSQGIDGFDRTRMFKPKKVKYLDWENGPEWWAEILDKMDAPLDLPNLQVICYPEFDGGLDTERGGQSALRLIESLGEIDLLIIDTASRAIEGSENDADTFTRLYRYFIQHLRKAGIGVIRLDHTGKNAELGARGSSAKMADLDAHYILSAKAKGSNDLTLKLDKRRQSHYDESVRILRSDGPLRHTRVPGGKLKLTNVDGTEVPEDSKVAALVAELDRLHISHTLTQRDQRSYYREKLGTVRAGSEIWTAATKFRRERSDRASE